MTIDLTMPIAKRKSNGLPFSKKATLVLKNHIGDVTISGFKGTIDVRNCHGIVRLEGANRLSDAIAIMQHTLRMIKELRKTGGVRWYLSGPETKIKNFLRGNHDLARTV